MTELLSGAEILMRALEAEGVKTIFGYPGGAIMPTFDALYDYVDYPDTPHRGTFHHVLVRHEQGAAHAAEGFARVSGEVGVCLVTSGPGATNTITGIADAMVDSTPIVVITGQVHKDVLGSDAFQECDIVDVTQPISKWAYQIRRPEDVAWAVSRAFYIARSGRPGPVVLDFTKGAQTGKAEYVPVKTTFIRSYDPVPEPDQAMVAEAARLINAAERPLVLVGQGVELAGAQKELIRFLETCGAPAGCTLMGLSALPSDHPLNMGMLGMHGALATNKQTQQCDLLIAIGMRFADRITGKVATYATQAKKIHFDIDRAEINKCVQVDVPVLGNCYETLGEVTRLLEKREHPEWIATFHPWQKQEQEEVIEPQTHPADGPLRMGEVIRKVTEATHDSAILVTDVGQNQMMAARYFRFSKPRSIVTSGGMGTMGYCLPAAIGATFGAPERTVCAIMGDGGLQMTIEEFGTIMEQRAPVKIILLNNNFLGNVRQWQNLFFRKRYSFTPMLNPDYDLIAKAYGIPSQTVTERNDLDGAIRRMLDTDGPFLLQCAVMNEDNVLPMCFPGNDVDDMVLTIDC